MDAEDPCDGPDLADDDDAVIPLVSADVLHPRRVDEHFAAEAAAARVAALDVVLVDYDTLPRATTRARCCPGVLDNTTAVYRGWMLGSGRYAALAAALRDRAVCLRTDADQYRRGHELPGRYSALAEFTPVSTWTVGSDQAEFDAARGRPARNATVALGGRTHRRTRASFRVVVTCGRPNDRRLGSAVRDHFYSEDGVLLLVEP